ncbi:MAG: RNA polymerase sigma factor, partial [Candidatus Obscuribacterales bacterium]|nr:RNA polymerase sigma factor [Candidatus Obscuribacterales bacterium]
RKGFLMFLKSRNSTNRLEDFDISAESTPQLRDDGPGPQQLVDLAEQSEIVESALGKIPETQRAVLVLHDMEGFSYQDISDIVGANLGTVRSRLHYGRLKMREILTPYFATDSETARSR